MIVQMKNDSLLERYYVCLDVGGTEVKAATLNDNGGFLSEIQYFPSLSKECKTDIINHFADIVLTVTKKSNISRLDGVRLGFPGPFDYVNGICLMEGLDKYESILNVNLKQELGDLIIAQCEIPLADGFDLRFVNDVGGFGLGELHFGCATKVDRVMFICIGTGCGSAFSINRQLVSESVDGVPDNGYVYGLPFKDSIIDDYISKRGLLNITLAMYGKPIEGRMLSKLAASGDRNAGICFDQFGEHIDSALMPVIESFRPAAIVLGGQITKSAPLFITKLQHSLDKINIALHLTEDTSKLTMQGLTKI